MIGIGLNIGNRVINSINADAQAFLTATGITDATQVNAVNRLVNDLQSYGLWSKMKALYPFVTDNRNLLSYTEDFGNAYWAKNNSSVTTNTAIAPNGTTTADTIADNTTNNFHGVSTFQSAFGQNGNNTFSIYAKANTLNYVLLYFYNGSEPSGKTAWFNLSNGTVGTVQSGLTASIESVGNGWYRCSITRNFNFTASNSNCGFGVSNADNVVSYLGTGQSLYVWGAQVDTGSTASTYQPIATTQQAFISNQFKYNLKNPVDSDAAFRLVFNGGWTFASTGATPNGTNGYADTKLNQASNLTPSNNHISVYSRTNANGSLIYNTQDCGITNNINYSFQVLISRAQDKATCEMGSQIVQVTNTDSRGHFIGTSTSSTSAKLYKNGSSIGTSTTTQTRTMFSNNVYLGASNESTSNNGVWFSPRQQAFASIGDGLTDTEASNFYTSVQQFNTTLGRQVI